jgi:hypothetical protein
MLLSGDFDMMRPLFKHYMNILDINRLATKKYYKHDGVAIPETTTIWGTYLNINYGSTEGRGGRPDGNTVNSYIRFHWTGGLELMAMMIHYHDMTGDDKFRDEILIPFSHEMITFYDQHWKRGEDGKIKFSPAQSLETYSNVVNPTPDVAALMYCIPKLLEKTNDPKLTQAWKKTLADLPPLPIRTDPKTGKSRIIPAKEYGRAGNLENPSLYTVFPFRLYSLTSSPKDYALAHGAWEARINREGTGWQQNAIQAAALGLTEEARNYIVASTKNVARGFRFPIMWGPNYDWTPDQDHGGVFQTATQYLAMQYDGDKIILAPAWPMDWRGYIKLNAPKNTTVEFKVYDGKITELKVTPASRRKDILLPKGVFIVK